MPLTASSPESASSRSTKKKNSSSNQSNMQVSPKQLRRFYEPLFLLHALDNIRGERQERADRSMSKGVSELSSQELRREFLSDLAYMCAYEKGGNATTAIAIESRPQGCVFWVAANRLAPKTKPFLQDLLLKLQDPEEAKLKVDEIAETCISFSRARIMKYLSLSKLDRRASIKYLLENPSADFSLLAAWLAKFEQDGTIIDVCRFAFENRQSREMEILKSLGQRAVVSAVPSEYRSKFQQIRHYIGRLGYHFRAAHTLVTAAKRFPDIFQGYEIQFLPSPIPERLPPKMFNKSKDLKSVIPRMLPADSAEVPALQTALTEMDRMYGISSKFAVTLEKGMEERPVHAELQLLEHFYENGLEFLRDTSGEEDKFIGCSKPACYCCQLYIKYHPCNLVLPSCHRKLYLRWQPPRLTGVKGLGHALKHQRDMLNAMVEDIRRDAIEHINSRSGRRVYHADSFTGLTSSLSGLSVSGQPLASIDETLVVPDFQVPLPWDQNVESGITVPGVDSVLTTSSSDDSQESVEYASIPDSWEVSSTTVGTPIEPDRTVSVNEYGEDEGNHETDEVDEDYEDGGAKLVC